MATRRTSTRYALEILQAIAWDNILRDKYTYDSGESVIITLPFIDGAANDYSYELREVYTRTLGDGTMQEAERTPPSWISESFGTLEGTAPTTTSVITINLRWRATQFADSTKVLTQDFAFCINAANLPLQWNSTIGDQYFEYGDAVQFFLPTASGGAAGSTRTYTLVGTRPTWLVFDRTDQDLSGTAPSSESTTSLTWRVTDGTTTLSQSFDVVVEDPDTNVLSWSAIADRSFAETLSIGFDLPEATGGTSPYTYTKRSGAAWISVSASGRVTGVTPAVTSATDYSVTVRVTDDAGATIDRTFTIEVTNVVGLTWSMPTDRSFVEGTVVSFDLPDAVGGTSPYTYSKQSGNAWVSISSAGAVSGTAPNVNADTDYEIEARVTDAAGATVDRTFTIEVTNMVSPTALFLPGVPDYEYNIGGTVSITLPEATGGTGAISYEVSGIPDWLSFDDDTFILSGTAPNTATSVDLIWIAEDSLTSFQRNFDIDVVVPLSMPVITNYNFDNGDTISITLPEAVGGSSPYTYSLTGRPSWLTLTGRALSGTAPDANSATRLTWTVTDDDGNMAEQSFNIGVTLGLSWTITDQSFIENASISFQLPAATGGTSPYTYSKQSGNAWVSVSASGLVTGTTPDVTSDTDYSITVRATDDVGATIDRTFTIEVENMEAEDMANLPTAVGDHASNPHVFVTGSNGLVYFKQTSGLGDGDTRWAVDDDALPSAALPVAGMAVGDLRGSPYVFVTGSNGLVYFKQTSGLGDGDTRWAVDDDALPSAAL